MKTKHWIVVAAASVAALAPILEAEHLPVKVAAVVAYLGTLAALILKSPLAKEAE